MNEIYLIDSPTVEKLRDLQNSYSELDISSVLLYFEIQKSYKKMKEHHDAILQNFDLSESKFTIMMLLSYEKDMILPPSEIAEKVGSKKSTITGILKGLEKRNLIVRKTLPHDKRTNYVQLTEEGLDKLQSFLPHNYEIVSKIFDVFSEEEKEKFYVLANKLKNNLEKDELL